MTSPDEQYLRNRVGEYHYRLRMRIQDYHSAQVIGQGRTFLHPENLPLVQAVATAVLKALFLYRRGHANACDIKLAENEIAVHGLPRQFSGFRILHLSDLHLDFDSDIAQALLRRVGGLEYDVCVITGDFRGATWGPSDDALRTVETFMQHLKTPVFGILGNHDFLEMVPPLEAMGIQMLLNEHAAIQRGGATLYLVGVDDPHFYEADNLERALNGIPPDALKILLSHSAEIYRAALACGVDYLLCGHTHGGQICLPWGRPVLYNAKQPRNMIRGPWRYEELTGYTNTGIGCSLVPVRLFSRPEITIHRLVCSTQPSSRRL